MIDDDFSPDRTQMLALGLLLLRAQNFPTMPFLRERDLYENMASGQGFGGLREYWLTDLERHGLIFIEEDYFVAGDELDSDPHNVGLTPAGTYYLVARAPLIAQNYKGLTADLPIEVVDAPWAVQAYYSPNPDEAAPTADAFVRFDHNQDAFKVALESLDGVAEALRADNKFGAENPAVRDRKLEEISAIRQLLEKREGWTSKLIAMGWGALGYLITQLADRPAGYAAERAWQALQSLVGLQ